MKKKWTIVLLMTLLAVIMVACSGGDVDTTNDNEGDNNGSDSSVTNDEEVTVQVWFGREDFIPDDAFETFHEENPNINVEYDVVPLEQADADFLRNKNAGNAPDIFQVFHESTQNLAAQGAVLNMSEYYDKWAEEDPDSYNKLLDQAFDIVSYEGDPYGLAIHFGPYFHVHRNDWYEEVGLDPAGPETWDDVIEHSRMIKDAGLSDYPYATVGGSNAPPLWFSSMFVSMGGEYTDSNAPIIDSEAGRYIFEWHQTMMKEELMNPETIAWESGEMRGGFISGNVAYMPEALNIYPIIQEELNYEEQWLPTYQPVRSGMNDYTPASFSWPMLVNSDTEHPEAVTEVLKYLSSEDISKQVALRYQPTTNEAVLLSDEFAEAHPWFERVKEGFLNSEILPSHVRQPEIYTILNDFKQEALTDLEADPEEVTKRYQELIDEIDE
ncbi:extracellular solute-binding protein [Gracilibacillus sp. YIM 98692]|uniref:ABC transporter substrate-binding protein n=1 Tax=Gracilibacillus sp. YIM 98692 TaxID=2663532 RepID=UPI0013D2594C|nr:extracellular solute-binding protein [Gracilibacillus sp. YIM 98692]